jgi:hypothetical protein
VFIDDHCKARWVEPICKVLPIAPSIHHDHVVKRAIPRGCGRWRSRGLELKPETECVFTANFKVYGARKIGADAVRRLPLLLAWCRHIADEPCHPDRDGCGSVWRIAQFSGITL